MNVSLWIRSSPPERASFTYTTLLAHFYKFYLQKKKKKTCGSYPIIPSFDMWQSCSGHLTEGEPKAPFNCLILLPGNHSSNPPSLLFLCLSNSLHSLSISPSQCSLFSHEVNTHKERCEWRGRGSWPNSTHWQERCHFHQTDVFHTCPVSLSFHA